MRYYGRFVLVSCAVRRGAFSGERVFRLPTADGLGDYSGVAPVGHCLDAHRNPLGDDRPPPGAEIGGFVEAFVIAVAGDRSAVRVELPDGAAVSVPADRVPYRGEPGRGTRYVPVGD